MAAQPALWSPAHGKNPLRDGVARIGYVGRFLTLRSGDGFQSVIVPRKPRTVATVSPYLHKRIARTSI
jgi:hypothetical protein